MLAFSYHVKYSYEMFRRRAIHRNPVPHLQSFDEHLETFGLAGHGDSAVDLKKPRVSLPDTWDHLGDPPAGHVLQSGLRRKGVIDGEEDEILGFSVFEQHAAIGKTVQQVLEQGTIEFLALEQRL